MKTAKIAKAPQIDLAGSVIFEGDALTVLRRLPDQAAQCIVTSPPYWGLRDYNIPEQIGLETTLPQYLNRLVGVFAEAKRVLADDGVFWLNIEDGYTSGNRGWRAPDKKQPQSFPGAHFATFPLKLIEPCILCSTRRVDYVLDPFFGAGTAELVAQQTGRKYVGIELHPEYVALAAERLEADERTIVKIAA